MKSFNKINTTRFNRTIKTLALGAVVAMTCSCEDFLTIYPTDKVVLENYWKTKTDVENVVANSYRMMLLPEFTERLIVWGELRGDNVIEGNYDPDKHGNIKNIMEANLLPQNGYNDWAHFYSIINNCNIVLKFAPQVLDEDPDFTEGDMNVTRGEMALMISRAFSFKHDNTTLGVSEALKLMGIASGYENGDFGIAHSIIRADFAVFLARAINEDLRIK